MWHGGDCLIAALEACYVAWMDVCDSSIRGLLCGIEGCVMIAVLELTSGIKHQMAAGATLTSTN